MKTKSHIRSTPNASKTAASHTGSSMREQILDAAVRLFAQKGYEATSTREIVEAAGVTKPMIYYYFQNKEGLGRAVLERFTTQFYSRLEQVVAATADPRAKLVEVIWTHFDYSQRNLDFSRFFYAMLFGPEERIFGEALAKAIERGLELRLRACRDVIAANIVPADCEEDLMTAVSGMINIWLMAALKRGIPLSRGLAERTVENMLAGLARR